MAIIKTGDLIDDAAIKDAISKLNKLGKSLEAQIKKVKKLAESSKGIMSGANASSSGGRQQIKEYAAEIDKLSRELKLLRTEYDKISNEEARYKELQKEVNRESRNAARFHNAEASSVNRLKAEINILTQKYNALSASTERGRKEKARLAAEIRKGNQALDEEQKRLGRATRNVGKYNKATQGLISTLKRFAAVYLGFEAFRSAVNITKDITVETDSLNLAYKQIIPDANKLAQTNKFLADTAEAYGINVNRLRKNYLRFTAASRSTNLSMEETQDIFNSVAKAGAVLGLEQIKMDRAFNAIEQSLSKGKVSSEELRQQLGDSLPGSMEIMAQALGVTTLGLSKMLEQGEILSEDALPKFARQLEITYGIETVRRVENLTAAQGRLETSIINLVNATGAKGVLVSFYDTLTNGVNYLSNVLRGNTGDISENVRALQNQKLELNTLVQEITDVNTAEDRRSALIGRLNAQFPQFLAGLSQEELTNANIRDRLDEVNSAYVRKIALQSIEDDVAKQVTKSLDAQNKAIQKQNELRKRFSQLVGSEEEANRLIDNAGGSILSAVSSFYKQEKGVDVSTFSQQGAVAPRQTGAPIQSDLIKIAKLYQEINDLQLESNNATDEAIKLRKDLNEALERMGFGLDFFNTTTNKITKNLAPSNEDGSKDKYNDLLSGIDLQRSFVEEAEDGFEKIQALRLLDLEKARIIRNRDVENAKEGTNEKIVAENNYLKQRFEINAETINSLKEFQDKVNKDEQDAKERENKLIEETLSLFRQQLDLELQIANNKTEAKGLDKQQETLELLTNEILYLRKILRLEEDKTKQKLIQAEIDKKEFEFRKTSSGISSSGKDAKVFGLSIRNMLKSADPTATEEKLNSQIEAITESWGLATQAMADYYRTAIQLSNQLVQQRNQEVNSAERALDRELEARNAGYANFVDDAQRRLDQAKKNQEEALKQRQEFQRQQLISDSILQASNLVTATTKLFSTIGFPFAVPLVAAMFGSFIASKAKAFQLTRQEFAEGGLEILGGGRHGSGKDTYLGFQTKDGKAAYGEQGEAHMILSRGVTSKYKDVLPTIFDSLNRGTFDKKMLEQANTTIPIINVNTKTDLTNTEKELRKIREQGERKDHYPANKRVKIKGNRTKIYV